MRLSPYIAKQRTTATMGILFLFVAAALNLAITFPVQWLGNNAFQSFDPALINAGFMAMIAIALVLGVASAVRFYFFSRFGERLAADLRGDVYARLMSLSPAYFSKLKTGEAVSRLTADVTLIETFFGSTFSMAVRSFVTSVGALVLMFITSWKLTGILFILAPVLILPILSMGRRVRKLSVNAQDRIAEAAAEATETIDAIDLVQAYGMEKEREGPLPLRHRAGVQGGAGADRRAGLADGHHHRADVCGRHRRCLDRRAGGAVRRDDGRRVHAVRAAGHVRRRRLCHRGRGDGRCDARVRRGAAGSGDPRPAAGYRRAAEPEADAGARSPAM